MANNDPNITISIRASDGVRYVTEKDIIRFPEGLLGFRDYTDFVFFDIDGCQPFRSMLSVKEGGPDFVIVETLSVIEDYKPHESLSALESFTRGSEVELVVLSIVTLSEQPEDVTINLRAPLLIDLETSQGKQVILDDDRYQTRYPLYVNA